MQLTFATLALAAASIVSAQGVPETIKPSGAAPAGCSPDYAGSFEITVVLPSKKRSIVERQTTCAADGTLVATLKNSVLTDSKGRTGAIVANRQFQFDGPPAQAGSIYTGGFSVCNNGSLALGPSAIFYQCLSGTFYNLYDQPAGAQCQAVLIEVIPCGAGGASQGSDGQPAGPSATSAAAQITDGQIQGSSAGPKATQIGDGQIQASSALPKPVSQYTDGQIQVTAPAVKATPVSQISDGQVQATSAVTKAPVSQISDGQVQATSAVTKAPVSQISDGQVQATSAVTKAPVSQISDGQVQATAASNATAPASTSPAPFTGSASMMTVGAQFVAGIAAVVAVAML